MSKFFLLLPRIGFGGSLNRWLFLYILSHPLPIADTVSSLCTAYVNKRQLVSIYDLSIQKCTFLLRNSENLRTFAANFNSTMAKKYIVMAEDGEQVLLDKAREQLGLDLKDATLIYTGVGAINIIQTLQDLDREAEIYNIGYAGSANFDLGTWVEVTEVRLNHPNVTYPEPELKLIDESLGAELPLDHDTVRAICYTNTDFVLASDYKDCVFDMELAFIAALGFKHLHALKYVSDNLSLHAYHDLTHGVE